MLVLRRYSASVLQIIVRGALQNFDRDQFHHLSLYCECLALNESL